MQIGYLNYVEGSFPTTELNHHGIKGQSWGVQNGPPYPLNQQKHNRVLAKAGSAIKKAGSSVKNRVEVSRQKRAAQKAQVKEERASRETNPRRMTDQQLNDNIARLRKEKEYKQLLADTRNAGRQKTQGMLSRVGTRAFETVATQAAVYAGRKAISMMMSSDEERARMFGSNWVRPLSEQKDKK